MKNSVRWNQLKLRDFRLCREVDEICALLVITQRNYLQIFRENLRVPSSMVKKSKRKTLEDGTTRFRRNVGNELPLYAA